MERCQEITANASVSIYEDVCLCLACVCRNVCVPGVRRNEAASWKSLVPSHSLGAIRG